jgi:hypothetical protein
MIIGPGQWRRLAIRFAQHASRVLPGARSPWADAMRHELDYIEDDAAAVRWAFGCVLASYRARLTQRYCFSALPTWRQVAASGALMLLIGLALQDHAGGQTEPPRPVSEETACDRSHHEAIQALRSQDRERFHRPISADARPIVCRSDCIEPLPPETTDACRAPDAPRSR